MFWVKQQRFDEFQYKLACFQRDVTEPRNPFINIFKVMQTVENPAAVPVGMLKKSEKVLKFGRVPKAGAFVLREAKEKKQTKFCSITLRNALQNNDIRAFAAVVASDRNRLDAIDFHPHLVFELARDNKDCVEFLLSYLHDASLNRRHNLFDCTISKDSSFEILKQCSVPAIWLRNSKITQTQRTYMWSIGYTEIAEFKSESADVEPLQADVEPLQADVEPLQADVEPDTVPLSASDPFGVEDHIPILGHNDSPCIAQ